jgi:transposase
MDLGDKTSRYCMLDENGEMLREASVGTTKGSYYTGLRNDEAMSRGNWSGDPFSWVRRLLKSFGHEVIVANALQVQLISNSRENDRMDAQMLAHLVRVDPRLLRPIQHRSDGIRSRFGMGTEITIEGPYIPSESAGRLDC